MPLEWNKIIPHPVFYYRYPLYIFWENKSIILQTLRGKQKYQVTNVGIEKIKLSHLLVQRINEFKMNEIQRKTPQ